MMAKDRGYVELENGRLPIDWATEETLGALLSAVNKLNIKTDQVRTDDKKESNENRKQNKELMDTIAKNIRESGLSSKKQEEAIDNLGKKIGSDTTNANKLVRDELKKQGVGNRDTRAVLKGMRNDARQQGVRESKSLRDILKATKESRVGRATGAASGMLGKLNPMGDVAGRMAAYTAGLGAVGAGAGLMLGSVEGFINATNSAMQSGFTFGDQLVETRAQVGAAGLNLQQFADILANNGESIRRLGGTGMEAQKQFAGLITNVMDASKEFGYFGFTSTETAGMLAPIVDQLAKAGMDQDAIAAEAQKTFMTLNTEVLGLAKLTGQDRREMLRQVSEARTDDLFQNLLSKLDKGATGAFDVVAANFTALGPQSKFFLDTFKGFVTLQQEGVDTFTDEQRMLLQQYPELNAVFSKMTTDLTGDSAELVSNIGNYVQSITDMAEKNEDRAAKNMRIHANNGNAAVAASSGAVLSVARETENLRDGVIAQSKATKEAMSANDAALMGVQQQVSVLMNTLQAQMLKLFGVEDITALSDENKMNDALGAINAFGDGLVSLKDFIVNISSSISSFIDTVGGYIVGEEEMAAMPEFNKILIGVAGLFVLPTVVSAVVGGLGALFAMKSVVGALSGAIGTMFGGVNAAKILGDSVGTTGTGKATVGRDPKTGKFTKLPQSTGRLGKLANLLKFGGKALPFLGTAIGGYQGIMDEGLKDAGYSNPLDRAALGITEGFFDLFDMGQNALGQVSNWGFGTDFRTDYDMSGAFRDIMTDPEVVKWMTDPIKTLLGESNPADTSVDGGYENMSQADFLSQYGAGGSSYNYDSGSEFSMPQPTSTDSVPVAPSAVFTTPEVATQPKLTAPDLETVSDVLSTDSATAQVNEQLRVLSKNLQPGITQQQAAEMIRYMKLTAENTDQ